MKRFIYARYTGETDHHYKQNFNYLLEKRPAYFRQRVSVINIHGYGNLKYPHSRRNYKNLFEFEQEWQVIEEHDNA